MEISAIKLKAQAEVAIAELTQVGFKIMFNFICKFLCNFLKLGIWIGKSSNDSTPPWNNRKDAKRSRKRFNGSSGKF